MDKQKNYDVRLRADTTITALPDDNDCRELTTQVQVKGDFDADDMISVAASIALNVAELGIEAAKLKPSETTYKYFVECIKEEMLELVAPRVREIEEMLNDVEE